MTAEELCAELGGDWKPANAPFGGGLRHAGGSARGIEIERPSGVADWLLYVWLWDQTEGLGAKDEILGKDPDDGLGLVLVVVYRPLTEDEAMELPMSRNQKYVITTARRQGGYSKCDERIHNSSHYPPLALGGAKMVEVALAKAASELYMALQVVKGGMQGYIPNAIRQIEVCGIGTADCHGGGGTPCKEFYGSGGSCDVCIHVRACHR